MAKPYKDVSYADRMPSNEGSVLGMPSEMALRAAAAGREDKAQVSPVAVTARMDSTSLTDPTKFAELVQSPQMLMQVINLPGNAGLLAELAQKPEFAEQFKQMRAALFGVEGGEKAMERLAEFGEHPAHQKVAAVAPRSRQQPGLSPV